MFEPSISKDDFQSTQIFPTYKIVLTYLPSSFNFEF